jgi:hypothetical protein
MFAPAKPASSTKGGLRWSKLKITRAQQPMIRFYCSYQWGTNSHFLSSKLQKNPLFWTAPDALLVAYMSYKLVVWKFTSELAVSPHRD